VTTFPAAQELGGALEDRDLAQMVAMGELMEVVGVALGQVGRERAWWIGYDDRCVYIGFLSFLLLLSSTLVNDCFHCPVQWSLLHTVYLNFLILYIFG